MLECGIAGRRAIVCASSRDDREQRDPDRADSGDIDPMAAHGVGRIVDINSGSVRMPVAGLDLSSGARVGLTAFLAGVARSIAHAGPPSQRPARLSSTPTATGPASAPPPRCSQRREQCAEERATTVPARRIGDPQVSGDACAFLCSARADYITGHDLLLDGGLLNSAF